MWEPRRLTTLWASTACHRDGFNVWGWEWLCVRFKNVVDMASDNINGGLWIGKDLDAGGRYDECNIPTFTGRNRRKTQEKHWTPCCPMKVTRLFGGTCRHNSWPKNKRSKKLACLLVVSCLVHSSTPKIVVTCFSETSVDFQRPTWRYIPEVQACRDWDSNRTSPKYKCCVTATPSSSVCVWGGGGGHAVDVCGYDRTWPSRSKLRPAQHHAAGNNMAAIIRREGAPKVHCTVFWKGSNRQVCEGLRRLTYLTYKWVVRGQQATGPSRTFREDDVWCHLAVRCKSSARSSASRCMADERIAPRIPNLGTTWRWTAMSKPLRGPHSGSERSLTHSWSWALNAMKKNIFGRRFMGTYFFHLQGRWECQAINKKQAKGLLICLLGLLFHPEDDGRKFMWNADAFYTAAYTRRQK
jgi:hypothetical protein